MSKLYRTALLPIAILQFLVPVLPGLMLMWCAALVYGLLVGFGPGGVVVMVLLTMLVTLGVAAGVVLPQRAASSAGSSRRTQIGAVIGAVIGFFAVPVVGVLIGALVGVWLVAFRETRDPGVAWSTTVELAKGFGRSALAQFGIGFVMLLVWSTWALAVLT